MIDIVEADNTSRAKGDSSKIAVDFLRPGAVVIGGDYQGLGIVRSLGRRGLPVCVIDDEFSISRFSKYTTYSIRVADLRNEEEAINTLLEAGQRLKLNGWVLFPTRDETVAAISRYKAQLQEIFRVPTPGWNVIQHTWDKRNTYALAKQLAIPIPSTWIPKNIEELRSLKLDFPIAIKPAIKEHFFYATRAKAWRANNQNELETLYNRAASQIGVDEIILQDLIPGDGQKQFAYCAFFKEGNGIGSMVVRRARQHPAEFGRASTFVETIDQPTVEAMSERFLRAIDYYGLVEMEYKLDPRDGQYKLLDVNARTWGYHSLGFEAGVDFPFFLYADQLGELVEPCRARIGVNWVRHLTDFPTAFSQILSGALSPREYLQSVRHVSADAVFTWKDPLPFVAELGLIPYMVMKRGF